MSDTVHFHNLKTGGIPRGLSSGIRARVFPGEHLMLSVVEIAPGSTSPVHAHPNEQIGMVTDGALHYTINGESKLCPAGAAFVIPPNSVHPAQVVSDRPAKLIDVLAPPRNIMEPLRYTDRDRSC